MNLPNKCVFIVTGLEHADVMTWKPFPHCLPFVWRIHHSPGDSHQKGSVIRSLDFSFMLGWTSRWPSSQGACEVRRHDAHFTWWRHQMETVSALLDICAGNSPVSGEFPAQRPVTRGFDVFFDLHPDKQLSKQSWGWWFETPSHSLWRHRNDCNGSVWVIASWKNYWYFISILPQGLTTFSKG